MLEPEPVQSKRAVSTFKVNAKSSEEKRKLDKLEAFAALQRETAAEAAAEDAAWADPSVIGRRRGRKAEFRVRRPPRAVLSRTIFLVLDRCARLARRRCVVSRTSSAASASFQSPADAAPRTDRRGDYGMRHRFVRCGATRVRSAHRPAPRRVGTRFFFSSRGFSHAPQVTLCREDVRFSLQFLCLPYERLGVGKRTPGWPRPLGPSDISYRSAELGALRNASRAALRLFPRRMKFGNG